ncbi:MAG: helix-turn-helix domain-containing protein [Actinomycetota bacterium]|nr:helix-turn-helix domain-containing protein [Actinomycetota bacterium]
MTSPNREPLIPLEPVLDYTGLSRSAHYSLRHRGEGPAAYRLGKRLMFRWADVEAWVETRRDEREPAA